MSPKRFLPAAAAAMMLVSTAGVGRANDIISGLSNLPLPQPVSLEEGVPDQCVRSNQVALQFATDGAAAGGKTFVLGDDLKQAFSDEWRRRLSAERETVTTVMAMVLPDPRGGSEPLVDMVEFDKAGCAMSRTMFTLGTWSALLQAASGTRV